MHLHENYVVPDGGYGWVIVSCSFLIHMFVVGTLYALSVVYIYWLEEFQNGKGYTSAILSLAVAVMFGIGPLPAELSRRFSNRFVVVLGGVLMFLGFFSSVFAVNVLYLIFTIGLVTGIGAGCCYLPAVSMVALYFDTKRSIAMGISASGLGVGAFLMPIYLNSMVEDYGWRGCLLILSGLSLNMCLLGILMHPPELAPTCTKCTTNTSNRAEVVFIEEVPNLPHQVSSFPHHVYTTCDITVSDDDSECDDSHSERRYHEVYASTAGSCKQHLLSRFDNNEDKNQLLPPSYSHTSKLVSRSLNHLSSQETTVSDLEKIKRNINRGGSLQHILPSTRQIKTPGMTISAVSLATSPCEHKTMSSTFNGLQMMMAGSLYNAVYSSRLIASMQTIPNHSLTAETSQAVNQPDEGDVTASMHGDGAIPKHDLRSKLLISFGVYLKLMQQGTFMVYCVSNFLTNLSFFMPVLYMVDRAVYEGFSSNEAAMFISCYGAGNIVGKLFFGWLADRDLVDRLVIYIGCITLAGASTSLSPLCGGDQMLHILYAICFGCFIGAYCTLFPIVTVDLVGRNVVDESFGLLLCFIGVATAFGSPLAGYIYDLTNSYTIAFVLHGLFIVLSAVMLVPLAVTRTRRKSTA